MTRIKYREQPDTTLESIVTFQHPTNGERYKVVIEPSSLYFKIVENHTNTTLVDGRACSLHKVKIKAKQKLMGLGITFQAEKRDVSSKEEITLT